ncbi:LamB/YcsF family protein [Gulosibacter chungangensis]|uniref:LamB/YcsF family protein n=1 Tax=Gulosibacter chungangensis TaxID=979746 RepID=A0A7J5BEX9_9MICO|nr:5-oxoprolinase subunit PxpA [Gulosibacter chungangensis]KAB1644718.1 LamB/YcsF family protein [Gulosibacter chungangensis]
MASIDLNSDLGENTPDRHVADDAGMLQIVSSANVACGFHAGDPIGIHTTLAEAKARGVIVGAHPGYRDYANFGRSPMTVEDSVLQADVEYQLGALLGLARRVEVPVRYVKPHGALYNTMAKDARIARVVAAAVRAIDPALVLLCLSGSESARVAEGLGLTVALEAFADRAYEADGALVSRTKAGSVLHDPRLVADRMLQLVETRKLTTIDGREITLEADSICVHGDSAGAVQMAVAVRELLLREGVQISPFVS